MTTREGRATGGIPAVTDDPPFVAQVCETFQGRQRGLTVLVWFEGFFFFILAVLCAWRYFQVDTPRLQIMYATCFLLFTLILVLLKIWFFILIHRNRVVERIVRLEERIAALASPTH
jgi:hypothetical protein